MPPSGRKILIADDDAAIRLVLSQALTRAGHVVRATGNAATLLKWASEGEGDLVITDVVMPDENIFEVLPRLARARPKLPVIVMSAQSNLATAVKAAEGGAFEYIAKPFDLDDMTAAAARALARPSVAEAARGQLRANRDERLPLVGRSAPMQEVYRIIARLVGADLTVLITGESGTGKGLTARALHEMGPRRTGRFVTLDLASLPRERVDRELFGDGDSGGLWAQADGGVLFLDQIGDMPLDAQTRLLQVFDGPSGALNPITGRPSSVRVVAAASRDLRGLIAQGLFREDLYFRLAVAPLRLPPLRERLDDIADLANAFLLRAHREGLPLKALDSAAIGRLQVHHWPGNVRELENLIRRVCALYPDQTIGARIIDRELSLQAGALEDQPDRLQSFTDLLRRHLAGRLADPGSAVGLHRRVIEEIERPLIELTLAATAGNQLRAADILGLNRNTLRKKIADLSVALPRRG